jgi:hypothetical protein
MAGAHKEGKTCLRRTLGAVLAAHGYFSRALEHVVMLHCVNLSRVRLNSIPIFHIFASNVFTVSSSKPYMISREDRTVADSRTSKQSRSAPNWSGPSSSNFGHPTRLDKSGVRLRVVVRDWWPTEPSFCASHLGKWQRIGKRELRMAHV